MKIKKSSAVEKRRMRGRVEVGIIMGSQSDWPTMQAAAETLKDFGISFEVEVVSAHRTVDRMYVYAQTAQARGLKVIIAGAGGAAHLPGMVASMTVLPVVGVPVKTKALDGMDSLLSIVQMPKGVPVATVAIDNAANAGLLAARIVGTFDAKVQSRLEQYQKKMLKKVRESNRKIAFKHNTFKRKLER